MAACVVVLGTSLLAVPAAASAEERPSVTGGDASVDVGATTNVTFTLDSAPKGVAGFDLAATVADGSVARVTDVSVADPFKLTDDSELREDGLNAYATGTDLDRAVEPGATDVALVTVTLEGLDDGWTTLSLSSLNVDDDDGNDIDPGVSAASIVVGDGDIGGGTENETAENGTDATATAAPGGNGGGGGGGDGQGSSSATTEWDTVDMADGATVNVREVPSGGTVEADLSGTTASEGVSLTGLDLTMRFETSQFRIETGTPTAEAGSGPNVTAADAEAAVGYFTVDAVGVDAQRIDSARIELGVEADTLPDGATHADLVVYRYHDGEWQSLETTTVGDATIVAETPGFSTFAVGVPSEQATATADATAATDATATSANESTVTTTGGGSEEGSDTATSVDGPGFGALAVLLALCAGGVGVRSWD